MRQHPSKMMPISILLSALILGNLGLAADASQSQKTTIRPVSEADCKELVEALGGHGKLEVPQGFKSLLDAYTPQGKHLPDVEADKLSQEEKIKVYTALIPGVNKWANVKRMNFNPIDEKVVKTLDKNGVVVVTVGGSSISSLVPEMHTTLKNYYDHTPEDIHQLIIMIADSAEPALEQFAEDGSYKNGILPILLMPSPGLVRNHSHITFPGNFGVLAGHEYPVADLLRAELVKRAEKLEISKEQLEKMMIYIENDSLPVAANASFLKLKNGDSASIMFVGTGTGSAKVVMTGDQTFEMLSSEESHMTLGDFPEVMKLVPKHMLKAAQIANTTAVDKPLAAHDITLENVSAGGRVTPFKTRSHLGGTNSVMLSYLLDTSERPQWINERAGGNEKEIQDLMIKGLGFNSLDEARKAIANSPIDQKLLNDIKEKGSIGGDEFGASQKQGSILADRLNTTNTYVQGLVGGILALNFGSTPAGNQIPADMIFGNSLAPKTELKLLIRASEGFTPWTQKYFTFAQQGLEDAKNAILTSPKYATALQAQGYNLDPSKVHFDVEKILPDPHVHPDFGGLDIFSGQLRARLGK